MSENFAKQILSWKFYSPESSGCKEFR